MYGGYEDCMKWRSKLQGWLANVVGHTENRYYERAKAVSAYDESKGWVGLRYVGVMSGGLV